MNAKIERVPPVVKPVVPLAVAKVLDETKEP